MALPKSLTTVTTFSKLLAMFLFILFPFVGFYAGMEYQEKLTTQPIIHNNPTESPTPQISQATPSCRPRPACLDATPRCMIPETSDMCPPSPKPTTIPRSCTDVAKRCSDGSFVTQSGPNCEFTACPKMCPNLSYKNPEGKTCSYSGPNCDLTCK